MSQGPKESFDQLIRDGYCLVEDVLDADILQHLRQVTDQLLDVQSQEIRDQQRSTGSMIDVGVHPIFAELVAYPPAHLQQYTDSYTSSDLNWRGSGE